MAKWVDPLLHTKASRHENFPPKHLRSQCAPDSALKGTDEGEGKTRETSSKGVSRRLVEHPSNLLAAGLRFLKGSVGIELERVGF